MFPVPVPVPVPIIHFLILFRFLIPVYSLILPLKLAHFFLWSMSTVKGLQYGKYFFSRCIV